MPLSTTPEAIRQRKSDARRQRKSREARAAKNMVRTDYTAKPEHHKLLKALLAELQA